jgi:hypothetical protein
LRRGYTLPKTPAGFLLAGYDRDYRLLGFRDVNQVQKLCYNQYLHERSVPNAMSKKAVC